MDDFTVVDLVPWPSSKCEADGDLVLIQTSFALLSYTLVGICHTFDLGSVLHVYIFLHI